jgi:hypothetical protein
LSPHRGVSPATSDVGCDDSDVMVPTMSRATSAPCLKYSMASSTCEEEPVHANTMRRVYSTSGPSTQSQRRRRCRFTATSYIPPMFPSLPEEDLLPPTLPIASPIAELSVAPSTDGTPANSPSPPMSPEQVRSISVLH